MSHKQVLVKVNAFVDEGIAPLIEALSLFPEIETYESCQGFPEEGEEAVVFFTAKDWRWLVSFQFDRLFPALYSARSGIVRAEVVAGPTWPDHKAIIILPLDFVPEAAKIVRSLLP